MSEVVCCNPAMVFYVRHKGFSMTSCMWQHSAGIINYNVDSKILMWDGGFYEVQGKYSASVCMLVPLTVLRRVSTSDSIKFSG